MDLWYKAYELIACARDRSLLIDSHRSFRTGWERCDARSNGTPKSTGVLSLSLDFRRKLLRAKTLLDAWRSGYGTTGWKPSSQESAAVDAEGRRFSKSGSGAQSSGRDAAIGKSSYLRPNPACKTTEPTCVQGWRFTPKSSASRHTALSRILLLV